MKTIQRPVFGLKALPAACLAIATSMTGYAPMAVAHSDGAVWGIGGLLAGSMLTMVHQKHKDQQKQSTAPAPAAPAPKTAEQKIQQLNTLAAGGYITPQEYKTEKQAILNSIVE